MKTPTLLLLATLALSSWSASSAMAQANVPIYTDRAVNGFQDWGWGTRNLNNTSPVHSGTDSISADPTSGPGISFHQNNFKTSPYADVSFWAHGGAAGGQVLNVSVTLDTIEQANYTLPPLTAGTWTQFIIPLSALHADNKTNFARINIKYGSGGNGVFYVDDIQLDAAPAPALVHVTADASQVLRSADARWSGVNTATWDGNLSQTATSRSLLQQLGCLTLRWPGGSTSDTYHWASDSTGNARFNNIATNIGAAAFITVNYGSGTSNEAAAWVRSANVTNHCAYKYWEIGNECYGTWENDINSPAHDPYTYAVRAAGFIALMKAADPTIKVGVVGAPGEDNYVNNTSHPATNPRTGLVHNGWTPVLLATLKSLGVTPDFLVHHVYPQWTDPNASPTPASDSDALVMQSGSQWPLDAANLRQMLTDYLGTSATNVELVCTENNSDSGGLGRQLTSIVNGLYYADSLGQLMKTEFNSLLWWDFRNGQGTTGSFDPTIYGWRTVGDEGIVGGTSTPLYPVFYAFKLMQYFVRPGDTVLNASSDYVLLGSYAVRKSDGAMNLLVINKDVATDFTAQVNLSNFTPSPTAFVRSFGIQQDEATRTNNTAPGSKDIQTNSAAVDVVFTNTFPAGSMTLLTISPAAPQLAAVAALPAEFDYQLQGQPGTPYVVQTSADLASGVWTSISTNLLQGSTVNLTNAIVPGSSQLFWRAVWQP